MSEDESSQAATPAPAPEGALCAVHPGSVADSICTRCGDYMCAACSQQRSLPECLACRARSSAGAFPFNREEYPLFALLDFAWDAFRREWVALTLLSTAMLVISQGLGFASRLLPLLSVGLHAPSGAAIAALTSFGVVAQVVVQLGGQLALYAWALRVIDGEALDAEDAIRGLRRLPQAVAQAAMIWLPIVVLGLAIMSPLFFMGVHRNTLGPVTALVLAGTLALLLAPALFYVGTGVAFASLVLVQDESIGALDAIRQSWDLVAGRRWAVFGALCVIGLIAAGGVVLCCVGVFPTLAYGMVAMTCLFRALQTPRS